MAEQIGGLFASLTLEMGPFLGNAAQAQSAVARMSSGIRRELGVMDRSVASFGQSSRVNFAAAGAAARSLDTASARVGLLRTTLLQATAAVGGFGAALTSNAVLRYATEAQKISNAFRSVTDSAAAAKAETLAVFASADRARASVSATTTLVTRMQRADQSADPQKIIRRAETIQKALALGGATPAERGSVAIQISQGFSSGNFQGDELRAIRESPLSPFLAKALGVSVGKLKEMGAEGKLTADVVAAALDKMASSVDARFAQTSATVDDTLTRLDNELTKVIGKLDTTYGGTRLLAGGLAYAADNMEMLVKAAMLLAAVFGSNMLARGVSGVGGGFGKRIKDAVEQNKALARDAAAELVAVQKQQVAAQTALSDAGRARAGDPFKLAPGSQQSAYLRAANQVKRVDGEILTLQQRLAEQRTKTSGITATTTARAVAAADRLLKAEKGVSDALRAQSDARARVAQAATRNIAALGMQATSTTRIAAVRDSAKLEKAARKDLTTALAEEVRERQRAADAAIRITELQTAAEQKAAQQRVDSIRREREIEAGITQARQQRGAASMQTLMLGSVAKQTGSAAALTAYKEAETNLNAINKRLGEQREVAARAARGIGALGQSWTVARSIGSSLVGFLGGPWGVALTAAGVAATVWGAKTAEAAQKAADARRLIEEANRELAGGDGPQAPAARSTLAQGELDERRRELETVTDALRKLGEQAQRQPVQLSPFGTSFKDTAKAAAEAKRASEAAAEIRASFEKLAGGNMPVDVFVARMKEIGQAVPAMRGITDEALKLAPKFQEASNAVAFFSKKVEEAEAKTKALAKVDPLDMARVLPPLTRIPGFDQTRRDQIDADAKRRAEMTREQADIEQRKQELLQMYRKASPSGSLLPGDEERAARVAKAAHDAAEAVKDRAKDTKDEARELERTETILARIRNRSAGSFLSDIDRKVLDETRRLPNSAQLQEQYVKAMTANTPSAAPKALLDVRAQLMIEESAEAFREIVKEWGTGEQVAAQLSERLEILNHLVGTGRVSLEQGAQAWRDYVASMSPAAKLAQELQFEGQQNGRMQGEQDIYARLKSANLLDSNGEITDPQAKILANQIAINQEVARWQDGVRGVGEELLGLARKGDLKGMLESVLGRVQGVLDKKIGEGLDSALNIGIAKLLGGTDTSALSTMATANMNVTAGTVIVGGAGVGSLLGGAGIGTAAVAKAVPSLAATGGVPTGAVATGGVPTFSQPSTVAASGAYADMIRASALKYGVDPTVALRVAQSEGGTSGWLQSKVVNSAGLREPSYGPFQALVGGKGTGFPAGQGNAMLAAGIDPRDPSQAQAALDWQMKYASQNGWSEWYGAKKVGISRWEGIGARPTSGAIDGIPVREPAPQPINVDAANQSLDALAKSTDQAATTAMPALTQATQQAATTAIPALTQNATQAAPALGQVGQQATGLGGVFQNLFQGLGNIIGSIGSGIGNIFSAIGGIFGGGKAVGGPVSSGLSYLVGERGPEIVRMNGSGRVLTAGRTAALLAGGMAFAGAAAASEPQVDAPLMRYERALAQMAEKAPESGGATQVNIHNNAGANVTAEERDDGRGGRSLEVMVDEVQAKNQRRPGSASSRAMQERYGAKPKTMRLG